MKHKHDYSGRYKPYKDEDAIYFCIDCGKKYPKIKTKQCNKCLKMYVISSMKHECKK